MKFGEIYTNDPTGEQYGSYAHCAIIAPNADHAKAAIMNSDNTFYNLTRGEFYDYVTQDIFEQPETPTSLTIHSEDLNIDEAKQEVDWRRSQCANCLAREICKPKTAKKETFRGSDEYIVTTNVHLRRAKLTGMVIGRDLSRFRFVKTPPQEEFKPNTKFREI